MCNVNSLLFLAASYGVGIATIGILFFYYDKIHLSTVSRVTKKAEINRDPRSVRWVLRRLDGGEVTTLVACVKPKTDSSDDHFRSSACGREFSVVASFDPRRRGDAGAQAGRRANFAISGRITAH